MPSIDHVLSPLRTLRRRIRASEAWFIGLAIIIGGIAGLLTVMQGAVARTLQHFLFGLAPTLRPSQMHRLNRLTC